MRRTPPYYAEDQPLFIHGKWLSKTNRQAMYRGQARKSVMSGLGLVELGTYASSDHLFLSVCW